MPLLKKLLKNTTNDVPDLLAALIVDLNGFIIAQQSNKMFDKEIIDSVVSLVKPTIKEFKKHGKTSFRSGTFDTKDFRLYYIELGGSIPVLFVLIYDIYFEIDNFLPYFYIVAEKISQILNNRNSSLFIPKLLEGGKLELKPRNDSLSMKNLTNNILVIGPERSGKSSLLEMYVNGNFVESYKPTIGLSIEEKELLLTKRIKITFFLFDMGGLKHFAKIRKNCYNISNPKAILLCFDYTRIDTLEKINEWLDEAKFYIKNNNIPYLLIGNKIDLVENRDKTRRKAEVIANQYGCLLFETSALTGEGIDDIFLYIASNCQY